MSASFPQLDKSKYYTKTEVHAYLDALQMGEYEFANAYYNKDFIDGLLDQYYLKTQVDQILSEFQGGTSTFTNSTPTPSTIGGITSGSTFDNVPITEVLNRLLYPYQNPTFTSFNIVGLTQAVEVGYTIPSGNKEFTWTTSNSSNITSNSITIIDVTNNITLGSTLPNANSTTLTTNSVTKNTATSHTWRIEATSTSNSTISRTFVVNWQWKVYYGESALSTLNASDVKALRVGTLKSSPNGTYNMLGGGYKWICYPVAMGLKTSFKDLDTQFDVALNPVEVVSITNDYGVATDYYCHRTYNVLGGGINIGVS